MGCDIEKLEYLSETKQLFRDKIDPKGAKITDATPFRSYVDYISGGGTPKEAAAVADGVAGIVGNATKIEEEE